MHDQNEELDFDEEDILLHFDISDVTPEIFTSKDRKSVALVGTSEEQFNLMRIYLWVCKVKEKMEQEMGIMEEPPEAQ